MLIAQGRTSGQHQSAVAVHIAELMVVKDVKTPTVLNVLLGASTATPPCPRMDVAAHGWRRHAIPRAKLPVKIVAARHATDGMRQRQPGMVEPLRVECRPGWRESCTWSTDRFIGGAAWRFWAGGRAARAADRLGRAPRDSQQFQRRPRLAAGRVSGDAGVPLVHASSSAPGLHRRQLARLHAHRRAAGCVRADSGGAGGQDPAFRPFSQILTGRSLLDRLAAPPVELSRQVAVARLRGSIVGPDGQQTCAVMTLADEAAEHLEPTLDLIREAAVAAGVPAGELRVGGIPVINAALNQESTASLVRLAGLSGLLGVLIAWLCFRDLRLTSLVLASGIYSAAASLAVVPLFGVPLNAILITMVPLVYVTGISGAIHLSNYYLEAARHGSLPEAPGKAVAHAAVPLVLAAVTTALGLLSLCYSELNPIRLFGVFSAIGVVIGSLAQFMLLPAALAVWTPLPRQQRLGARCARRSAILPTCALSAVGRVGGRASRRSSRPPAWC